MAAPLPRVSLPGLELRGSCIHGGGSAGSCLPPPRQIRLRRSEGRAGAGREDPGRQVGGVSC